MDARFVDRVLDLAVAIQQIPAPPFAEDQRARYVQERLFEEKATDVSVDVLGNVYARLPGEGNARPVVITAHLDTVFPMGTALTIERTVKKIAGPGIGDNSIGVAGLFGVMWALREREVKLPGDVWLVANVGEEGLGDLRGMRAVVDRFGGEPLAYIILEGMTYGYIYHRALGVRRYRVRVCTPGGHSWSDYGTPSAIHELAKLATEMAALPLSSDPLSTLNVGVILGGTSVNTIAAEASLELDLRSAGVKELHDLVGEVERLVKEAKHQDVDVSADVIGDRPVGEIAAEHPLVEVAAESLRKRGRQPELYIGSTDANIPLSRGYAAICIGLTTGGGAHTLEEYIHTDFLKDGLGHVLDVILGVFEKLR